MITKTLFATIFCMMFATLGFALPPSNSDVSTPEGLARVLSELLRDAIPRQFEKRENWDHQKRITTGLKGHRDGLNYRIHRRRKMVNHGTWKHYRVSMAQPEKDFDFKIENLRSLEPGKIAFTCRLATDLDGWSRARVYNRGLHVVTLTAEGSTNLQLELECELGLTVTTTCAQVTPRVVSAHLDLDDFDLQRISKAKGKLVHELGNGLRFLIEEELEGEKLAAKLNRAIDKKKDRLKFTPARLVGPSS